MLSQNRGEWSELYGILLLLVRPKLKLVDSNLQFITEEIFTLKEIIIESKDTINYKIIGDSIAVYINAKSSNTYSIEEIDNKRKELLKAINSNHLTKGAFEIVEISNFLSNFTNDNQVKQKSFKKEDLITFVLDNKIGDERELTYSIKSMLGSPATLLNSSSQTNFKYTVKGLNDKQVSEINNINSSSKIKDRIEKIRSYGGEISFSSIPCHELEYNLKMIDSNMPLYISNALLEFYYYSNKGKSLKELFIDSNNFEDEVFGIKKLGDFLSASSFGFFPSKKWDGLKTVTGGIFIIDKNGDGLILDLIYYEHEVRNFLINETKLDTPSTSRYHQAELKKDKDGEYSFTLNLQIRYKK